MKCPNIGCNSQRDGECTAVPCKHIQELADPVSGAVAEVQPMEPTLLDTIAEQAARIVFLEHRLQEKEDSSSCAEHPTNRTKYKCIECGWQGFDPVVFADGWGCKKCNRLYRDVSSHGDLEKQG